MATVVVVTTLVFSSEGFPEDRIRAVLHQIELGLKHESTNFGLHLISVGIAPL